MLAKRYPDEFDVIYREERVARGLTAEPRNVGYKIRALPKEQRSPLQKLNDALKEIKARESGSEGSHP